MDKNLYKVLLEELTNASKTLQKYEDKAIAGEAEPTKFLAERITYWSGVCDKVRGQLFTTTVTE